jgi:hypothetical protein
MARRYDSFMRLFLLLAAASMALAQTEPEILLHQTFESSTDAWMPVGEGKTVHSSGGSLAFEYNLAPQHLALLALPAPTPLARAARLRFSVKADHSTAMAVVLSEKKPGGGNYMAWFWAPANQWQAVDLTPADFTVTDGQGDPVDADGKLDLEAVESIGIVDLAQFFGGLKAQPSVPVRVDDASGAHTLLLDRFDLLGGPAPGADARRSPFDRGFLDWVSPGGMELKLNAAQNPLGERALVASYTHREGQFDVLVRREAARPAAADAKPARLAFDIASEKEVTLMVSLEMKKPGGGDGPRYMLPIYPPGGREVFHVDVKLADFQGPGTFDPGQWRTTAILDVTDADGQNTIWIGNVRTLN